MKLLQELLHSSIQQSVSESKNKPENFDEMIDAFTDAEKLYRSEGRAGVAMIASICRVIGYKDPQYFGQLSRKASIGDLINFLEDNPGAIEDLVKFIKQHGQHSDEWKENLAEYLASEHGIGADSDGNDDEEER